MVVEPDRDVVVVLAPVEAGEMLVDVVVDEVDDVAPLDVVVGPCDVPDPFVEPVEHDASAVDAAITKATFRKATFRDRA